MLYLYNVYFIDFAHVAYHNVLATSHLFDLYQWYNLWRLKKQPIFYMFVSQMSISQYFICLVTTNHNGQNVKWAICICLVGICQFFCFVHFFPAASNWTFTFEIFFFFCIFFFAECKNTRNINILIICICLLVLGILFIYATINK